MLPLFVEVSAISCLIVDTGETPADMYYFPITKVHCGTNNVADFNKIGGVNGPV